MWIFILLKVKGGTYWNRGHCVEKYGTVTRSQKEALIQNTFMLLTAE